QGGEAQQGGPGGQPGQSQGGQGESGQGDQQQQQQVLTLGGSGPPNAILEIPGMGQSRPSPGSGPAMQGPGAGAGHDPSTLDDPTRLGGTRRDVRVEGEAQAQGPTRSEVIMSSAQRGFATRDYRDVYTDYSEHAEEALEQDEIPQGYRFYVRRYFTLIRPRDAP
ncbi:MAG: hypothetical protein K8H88_09950, partial [Sandaracinaceae bacterium]|nr:hypothetical protein [Sandaracinaceae bacterium]